MQIYDGGEAPGRDLVVGGVVSPAQEVRGFPQSKPPSDDMKRRSR